MSYATQTCIVVHCDSCTEPMKGFEESFTVHFDLIGEVDEAIRDYEWHKDAEGKLTCDACLRAIEEGLVDELYLRLKGAREKLCSAQTLITGDDDAADVDRAILSAAILRIDSVGTTRCPQWSRFDKPSEDVTTGAEG